MKKKTLIILLTINALTLSACGTSTGNSSDTASSDTDTALEETGETSDSDTAAGTDVTTAGTDNAAAGTQTATDETAVTVSTYPTKFSVTYEKKTEDTTADDGTVILTSTVEIPTIVSEDAADIARKINEDMTAYLNSSSASSETIRWAQEDYKNSNGEDGFMFHAYTDDIYVKTTRMDDNVISFEITFYSYTGGAHGNYISIGRNYNAQTGEQIAFDDLSEDPASFRTAVSDYLTELANTPSYQVQLFPLDTAYGAAELEPVLLADDKWFLSTSGLTFISDPYALGPYAAGTIYFTIPYTDLEGMKFKDYGYFGNFTSRQRYDYPYDAQTGELAADGMPQYSLDLNGDGIQEGIAFYGSVYSEEDEKSHISLYINGTQIGSSLEEKMDLSEGYLDSYYVLYDLDPKDSYVEIGIPFTVIDETAQSYPEYTYFYRYTSQGELIYLGQIDGNAADPDADFNNFRE